MRKLIASYTGDMVGKREERIPQWGYQETKDFITIRAELEKDFTQTKRNKSLWEIISAKMKERGHRRSADQCKCKWKNLYNRYKAMTISQGMDSTDLEGGRACPFYEELHAIFAESDKSPDGVGMDQTKRRSRSSEECSEEEEEEDGGAEEISEEEERAMKRCRKRAKGAKRDKCSSNTRANTMQEVLEEYFAQQQRVEREWMEAVGRREAERRAREAEWREGMQALERERLAREQQWREREEQRRAREEARAQKRDALFSALLSRLAG